MRDDVEVDAHPADPADPLYLDKIVAAWNAGLAHYGVLGPKWHHLWHYSHGVLPRWYAHLWTPPSADRPRALSYRIGTYHHRATVAVPWKEIAQRLRVYLQTKKISRSTFFAEMRQSRAVLSPFDLGDITLRDFEAVICGAAVLKQGMSHLETWPDLWTPNKTYIPIAGDFSDINLRIAEVLRDPDRTAAIATAAQQRYAHALFSEEGRTEFCDRLHALVAPERRAAAPSRQEHAIIR